MSHLTTHNLYNDVLTARMKGLRPARRKNLSLVLNRVHGIDFIGTAILIALVCVSLFFPLTFAISDAKSLPLPRLSKTVICRCVTAGALIQCHEILVSLGQRSRLFTIPYKYAAQRCCHGFIITGWCLSVLSLSWHFVGLYQKGEFNVFQIVYSRDRHSLHTLLRNVAFNSLGWKPHV